MGSKPGFVIIQDNNFLNNLVSRKIPNILPQWRHSPTCTKSLFRDMWEFHQLHFLRRRMSSPKRLRGENAHNTETRCIYKSHNFLLGQSHFLCLLSVSQWLQCQPVLCETRQKPVPVLPRNAPSYNFITTQKDCETERKNHRQRHEDKVKGKKKRLKEGKRKTEKEEEQEINCEKSWP